MAATRACPSHPSHTVWVRPEVGPAHGPCSDSGPARATARAGIRAASQDSVGRTAAWGVAARRARCTHSNPRDAIPHQGLSQAG